MDIHLLRLVAGTPVAVEQICVISTGWTGLRRAGTRLGPKKNRAGPRPCSEKRKSTKRYAELTPRISVIDRDGCGFAPPCPPKTWTARSSALQVASPLDLATSTLADLPGLVIEK
jgi:hypothetical protein